MTTYTATAVRRDRYWFVQCDQAPGAMSTVARLDQAAEHQREAIAFVTGEDEADVDVTVSPRLPDGVVDELARARQLRETAGQLWMLDPLPAWQPTRNHLARLARSPKHQLADPALAASVGLWAADFRINAPNGSGTLMVVGAVSEVEGGVDRPPKGLGSTFDRKHVVPGQTFDHRRSGVA